MKSIAFTIAAIAMATSVSAMEVNASYVRDFNLDKNGVRVSALVEDLPLNPELSLVHVSNSYTRYSAGVNYDLASVGKANVSVTGAGVFQSTSSAANGFGFTVGVKTSVDLMKNVSLDARVEQFVGQKKVSAFDGTTFTIGASYRF